VVLAMISTGIAVAISLLVKSAPNWLPIVSDAVLTPARDAIIGRSIEKGIDKSIEVRRWLTNADEKELTHHLELALKNAAERGSARFQTLPEQQQYSDVLTTLSQPGPLNDQLRREALRLFTLDAPDLVKLNSLYIEAIRIHSHDEALPALDITPYINSFFQALISELYIDPLFHNKISDVIKIQAERHIQRSLTEVVDILRLIYGNLDQGYTLEQFEKDLQTYLWHVERTLCYLDIA
jgi:replicative superfamily II helicase